MQIPDHYLSMQVKNKPNGGIAFPAFILGAGMVMNKNLYLRTVSSHSSLITLSP